MQYTNYIVPLHSFSKIYDLLMKKLCRSSNKMLAGVCAGIAEYLNVDPTIVRVAYVALSLFSACFPGLILYIIMMIIMPDCNYD